MLVPKLEKRIEQALQNRYTLKGHIDDYAETGKRGYAILIENDLKHIKQFYGQDVYDVLNTRYEKIKETYNEK